MILLAANMLLLLPPWEQGKFAEGYVDFANELPFQDAYKLAGLSVAPKQTEKEALETYLLRNISDPFCWKQSLDSYLAAGKLTQFVNAASKVNMARSGATISAQKDKARTIGYINMIIECHLSKQPDVSKKLHASYERSLFNVRGLPTCTPHSSKLDLVLQLIASYGSVPKYKELASWLEKLDPKSFYPRFCQADSYRFGSDDGNGEIVLPDIQKLISRFKELSIAFPDAPTPHYMIFAYTAKTNPQQAKKSAQKYLRLENRRFRQDRVEQAQKYTSN